MTSQMTYSSESSDTDVMIRNMLHYSFSDIVLSIIQLCYWFIWHIIKVCIFAMPTCTGLFRSMCYA